MKYRKVGKWGVRLSCLGLGSWLTIGFKCDEETSSDLIRVAYENGINFFDTANVYNKGESERVLGKHLKDYPRSSLFILTKVCGPMGEGPNDKGLSAKHIFEQCHASLKRLNMNYIDAYICHRFDPVTPLEETIRAMEDLARQGKILYWGVSEWTSSQIIQAQGIARQIGARPISISEPRYNLLYRYPERELFATTDSEGIGNVIFSPLAHGMLTGKYLPGQPPLRSSRASDPEQNQFMMRHFWSEENKKRGQRLVQIAKEMDIDTAELAIAWCLKRQEVTSVILGVRKVEQLKQNLKAAEIEIPDEIVGKLDKLYPPITEVPVV